MNWVVWRIAVVWGLCECLTQVGRRGIRRKNRRTKGVVEEASRLQPDAPPSGRSAFPEAAAIVSAKFVGQHEAAFTHEDGTETILDTRTLDQSNDRRAWFLARAALDVTASEFAAAAFDSSSFFSRAELLKSKASGMDRKSVSNDATRFGIANEHKAVEQYARDRNASVNSTGCLPLLQKALIAFCRGPSKTGANVLRLGSGRTSTTAWARRPTASSWTGTKYVFSAANATSNRKPADPRPLGGQVLLRAPVPEVLPAVGALSGEVLRPSARAAGLLRRPMVRPRRVDPEEFGVAKLLRGTSLQE
ncbi:hypothetical protein M885DRAFT_331017 [Pelagophyceae sp. CCMP2097]|nr:hypothetical protein M885DRAFT_331017 [Pelagophyceae sp. CCMP2097]